MEERYDRQLLVFGPEGQERFRHTSVAVIGVGGIGAEVVLQLVRLGVERLLLVDPDLVEASNLNRMAGSTLKDAQSQSPKVDMLKRIALAINPDLHVAVMKDSILEEEVQEHTKTYDLVFGCVDNQLARFALNRLSVRYLIPYIDAGTGIQVNSRHEIEHAGGQVRIVLPGMGCLNCINGIDLDKANLETLPPSERLLPHQGGYIQGAEVKAPAVASLNGVIASLAVTEFMAWVTGFRPVHRYIFYDFMAARTMVLNFPRDPNCFTCSPSSNPACSGRRQIRPPITRRPPRPIRSTGR